MDIIGDKSYNDNTVSRKQPISALFGLYIAINGY